MTTNKKNKKKIALTLLTTTVVCTAAVAGATAVYAAPGNMGTFNSSQSFGSQAMGNSFGVPGGQTMDGSTGTFPGGQTMDGSTGTFPGDQTMDGSTGTFPGGQTMDGSTGTFPDGQTMDGSTGTFTGGQTMDGSTGFPGESAGFGGMMQGSTAVTVSDVTSGSVKSGSYNNADAVTLSFSDSGITASEDGGYEIDGTSLKITEAGTYILTGSCSDGTVVVKKGVTGVTLVLNGLSLTSSDSAPITCNKSSEVTIYAADGSVNYLEDTEQNNDETYTDNENAENAVIKCKDGSDVTISGSGTINVVANGKNGIKSGATTDEEGSASLTIENVTLNITAYANDGINAEAELNIESGSLTISAADDAVHCDLDLNIGAEGTNGPDIMIESCCEGLEGATIDVYSGDIDINATDDGMNAANSDLTGYTFALNIYGGDIYINTPSGDGIDSNGALYIYDGTVEVFSQSSGDNSPLDTETGAYIYGGTVLGVGTSGMGETISADQAMVTFSANVSAGSTVTIKDASGNTVYSAEAVRSAGYVIFSSDDLTSGSSYTLYVNNSAAATATASTGTASGMFGGMGGMTGMFGGEMGTMPGMSGSTDSAMGSMPGMSGSTDSAMGTMPGSSDMSGMTGGMGTMPGMSGSMGSMPGMNSFN